VGSQHFASRKIVFPTSPRRQIISLAGVNVMRMNTAFSLGQASRCFGGLTCLHQPCFEFLSVDFQPPRWLAALTRMRLTTTVMCQLRGADVSSLPTVCYLTAVAFVQYLIIRTHSWYPDYLKIIVLGQGTCTPQVIRHDGRTKCVNASCVLTSF